MEISKVFSTTYLNIKCQDYGIFFVDLHFKKSEQFFSVPGFLKLSPGTGNVSIFFQNQDERFSLRKK